MCTGDQLRPTPVAATDAGMSRLSPAATGSMPADLSPAVSVIAAVFFGPSCSVRRVTASARDSPPIATPATDALRGTWSPETA